MTYKSDFLTILEERGFINQGSDLEGLDKKLCSGMQTAYIGYDPTGTSLHIGHLYTLMMLYWFQQAGHRPISLMGGATALIPDPTLKDKTRPLLTPEEIEQNIAGIKKVFSRYLNYDTGKNAAIMENNYDWLAGKGYIEFLREIGLHFTINRMLTFDSVKSRLERELPMTFIEFNYMILQGYDFVQLARRHECVLQMGGSDQWGNIINGVELNRRMDGREVFALTAPLLTTSEGKKMGKTEGGAVWLNEDLCSAYNYYQYWRNVDDSAVGQLLKVFTVLPLDEIRRLEKLEGVEINDAKKVLAFEATKLCRGELAAKEAEETARKVFEQGSIGDDLPSITVTLSRLSAGISLVDLFVETGLATSKGEARRLIQGGGAKVNDRKIEDINAVSSETDLEDRLLKLSAGKKKHALVKAE
ncbi:MAG: tyrosine--tRNA ligase [Rhodospirillales bacterium]|nr:tyrosine--tRNA ligase [Rhodospirillales bacterium]MCB9973156.1 tyrosine--tRNA ligase [Rhodospirillales bacterium]MCB9980148.1 tyrosine--tRNA ligase [Rhodospirillales bacterium]